MVSKTTLYGIVRWGLLEWDSAFFKKKIFRITHLLLSDSRGRGDVAKSLIRSVLSICKRQGASYIFTSVEASQFVSHRALINNGFIVVDSRVTLRIARRRIALELRKPSKEFIVRRVQISDKKDIETISADSFVYSRFYSDPFFKKDDADKLHRVWIRNIGEDLKKNVFVAQVQSKAKGFITCHRDGSRGIIELVAVNSEMRGKGIGKALLSKVLEWAYAEGIDVEVTTQIYNYPALNLYVESGFRIIRSEIGYSKELS